MIASSENDLPAFNQESRAKLRRDLVDARRPAEARTKRILARLLFEERVREAQGKVVVLEDAAAVGWLAIVFGGLMRFLQHFGLRAPQDMLDRLAEGARRQRDQLLNVDGPALVRIADDAASAIVERPGDAAPDPAPHVGDPPAPAPREPAHLVHNGGGRWG